MPASPCTRFLRSAPQAAYGRGQRFEGRWPGYRYWFSDGVPAVVS
ncbi:hypothetical protein SAMN05192556_102150 [Halomonas caseinilytica]|uniref:Uncharacterized protein n=1 Tax=Halomonas caseinilytica TaxID=438744 RepID=A0A1M6QWD7_9GAMM|nr:hypothetical protein SAMN04487952_101150 [Halomonas caseinilytica]SHK24515.1 hypothetical protein SAMN05192556_102150 [Halomonas caseinilytica]